MSRIDAEHARTRARRRDAVEQRNQLEAQAAPAERKRLEQHDGRRGRVERGEQALHTIAAELVVDRNAVGIAQRREARIGDLHRRQLDDAHVVRHPSGQRNAAGHEMHVGAARGQRLGDAPHALEMSGAQQVLDPDQDAREALTR